ncbi:MULTISPECIES: THUMP-like domain-containing protein [unclassified Flavobacterium]|uniref:THUMP-like domain-containing protein n=1 Tax=unclassified Flavobacterium TaxID=196869 RepID=UPI00131DEF9E|nr:MULTISPECIES: class I SAM-dependent methyltransferase [unclassified Flavobacterium]
MNSKILDSDIQLFINNNLDKNIAQLALQKNPFDSVDWIQIINQIEAKAKAKDKLPTWFTTALMYYPSKISVEQTSSEKTAAYKASLIHGTSLIDLTGGFGVDDYYFSKIFKDVAHCEINTELSQIAKHNFNQLNCNSITCYSGDSNETLKNINKNWDWIYIDPSRRNDAKGKVFMLKDCLPNVPENLDFYFQKSNSILIKTAPLLDITAGLSELKCVKNIHIIALENEVKELLWELHKEYSGNTTIKSVNLTKNEIENFDFVWNDNSQIATYSEPQKYLYEANSAIMKSGGFDAVSAYYKVNKLHKHSHLYTSNEQIPFPGRTFQIRKSFPYSKNEMKIQLENKKANITIRNFPDTVEKIRKKWKIKDGGDTYFFFTIDENNDKIVLLCDKI